MKRGVLLVSRFDDVNMHKIRNVLHHRKAPVYHIDITQQRSPSDLYFSISTEASAAQVRDRYGLQFDPDDIHGVWCRSAAFHPHSPPNAGTADNFIKNEEIYALEYLFFLLGHATWVNPIFPPFLTRRAIANRLIQARLASYVGFHVSPQVVSNSLHTLRQFAVRGAEHGVVNKQISQGSGAEAGPLLVLTQKIDAHSADKQSEQCGCPVLLQNYVDKGYEIRAVVVGDTVFAAAIDTASQGRSFVDSRESFRTDLTYYRIELETDEVEKLIRLNSLMGLRYSAVDLIRRPDGSLVFLESNPSGQWGFIETFTGYPITERIVEELLQ